MTYCTDIAAQNGILDVGRRMYERAYVASNDGNISCRTGENRIWITPTGVSKGFMTHDMLICTDLDGNILQGTHKASSEIKMHLRVYKENPEVCAVVHAHPIAATSFAITRTPLDISVLPEAVVGLGCVPVAEYATTGSAEVPSSIAPYCRDYNAVLLANHGALTWGANVLQAYYRMETLECYAQILINLGYLSRPACLLTHKQTQELVDIRTALGTAGGGFPRCKEDFDV